MELTTPTLRQRIAVLRWALPLFFFLLSVFYQLVLALWVHDNIGENAHFASEIFFYGTVGPLLAFWAMSLVSRWLDEKERIEKFAQASERRLASITSASADAILSLDPAGSIESWNRGAELLFGYTENEVHGCPLTVLLDESEASELRLNKLFENVRQNDFVRNYETTCVTASGTTIFVELTATCLTGPVGQTIGFSVILRDITRRKYREEEIRHLNTRLNEQVDERTRQLAEKVEALGRANDELQKLDQMRAEFVSLVSHQIRGPLTNIRGALERMRSGCSLVSDTCDHMFTILNSQVERLDCLVQDVLNATRIESGDLILQREPLSIFPIVAQVVEQTLARKTSRLISLPEQTVFPLIYADRDCTAEILANLLDNAEKYSPPGENVEVDISAEQENITVTIQDHGSGISPEKLPNLFEKFYRTDGSDSQTAYGYGLGLYVCRLLVEALDGHIWAENHPQGGAVFSFTLPLWHGEDG